MIAFQYVNFVISLSKVGASIMSYTQEGRAQLEDSLQQLSPERLQVVADFAAYLADAESEAATQELLAIPGLLDRVKQCEATPKADYKNWRELRSDV
jgi:flagellar motility protein MotE (MotC chaperone)